MQYRKCFNFLISIMLCVLVNSVNIYASERAVSIEIPVSIKLEGDIPVTSDEFEIILLPVNEQMPMPEDGLNIVKIKGENTGYFETIHFSKPGIYEYTLNQIEKETTCIYDRKIYHLKVYVTNSPDDLEVTTIIYETNENDKVSMPIFVNEYPKRETNQSNGVTTGDASNLEMNTITAVTSLAIMIYIIWINRKKEETE